ncbi:MAG: polyhydroxyalkanoate synthesis regulator DNA-binding domain-containing protein [Myxococcota bacterium]
MSTQPAAKDDAQTPKGPKIVKRYSNRKLYDTDRSRYVTLDEIAKMIKVGEEVTIIDNESKEDLTSVTLTQIIYEEEKRESRMPLAMLRNLIQTGGTTLQDFFDKQVKAPVGQMRDSAQKSVDELRQSAEQIREAATRGVSELTDSARRLFSREERRAEEFRGAFIHLFDALEDQIESRIQDVKDAYSAFEAHAADPNTDNASPKQAKDSIKTEAHIAAIRERLEGLTELVGRFEATLREHEAKAVAAMERSQEAHAANAAEQENAAQPSEDREAGTETQT